MAQFANGEDRGNNCSYPITILEKKGVMFIKNILRMARMAENSEFTYIY